jgi:hypothetical protein
MKYLKIAYDTLWFRCHPVWQDERGRALYPSWRASFDVARIIASVK